VVGGGGVGEGVPSVLLLDELRQVYPWDIFVRMQCHIAHVSFRKNATLWRFHERGVRKCA